jgi:hypothetical protein
MAEIRETLLEADFLNDVIIMHPLKANILSELKEKFFSTVVSEFWHTEKDQLEFFAYYSTGSYFCQRRKLKYDFKENVSYWTTYSFTGAPADESKQLYEQISNFFSVIQEVKRLRYEELIEKVEDEALFFDQRYVKKITEKNEMLGSSDWRVLPDIVDKYPGEKDMWIKWRYTLRTKTIKSPKEFERGLDFAKYLYEMKWPIDPSKYWDIYPNGEVEYLSTDDQWVEYDSLASTDFVNSRIVNLSKIAGNYSESFQKVKSATLEMMKIMGIDEIAPVDWNIYYSDESELQ